MFLRPWLILIPFLICCAWTSLAEPAGTPPINAIAGASAQPIWRHDFKSAEAEAKRQGLPLIVHFYAEWCGPCQQMERETLGSLALQRQVQGRFIAVKIDSDKHPDLVQRFRIDSLPSDLILGNDGAILARSGKYVSQQEYFSRLSEVHARVTRDQKIHIAGQSNPTPTPKPVQSPVAAPGPKLGPADPTHGILPDLTPDQAVPVARPKWALGLRGFNPVVLANQKRWVKGDKQFAADHKGIVYHMNSAAEVTEFRTNPDRYAPQLLGCDPVILEETDRAVVGDTRFGVYYDGELYFFVNAANREKFKTSPHRFTRTKHVLNLKKIQESEIR